MLLLYFYFFFFFFNDTATTEIYTLSLHDALPFLGENELEQVGATTAELLRHGEREVPSLAHIVVVLERKGVLAIVSRSSFSEDVGETARELDDLTLALVERSPHRAIL